MISGKPYCFKINCTEWIINEIVKERLKDWMNDKSKL